MIGIDQLSAEFDEHAVFVEISLGPHATAEAFQGLIQMHLDTCLHQFEGGGETSDAAADNGDGSFDLLSYCRRSGRILSAKTQGGGHARCTGNADEITTTGDGG